MARASADKSVPPPLRALGGWAEAAWFDPLILSEDRVVGLALPAFGGRRKQNFELAERVVRERPARKTTAQTSGTLPEPAPSDIAEILDAVGAIRVAAFRRPRFFFDTAPSLFFAQIPAANLKVRAANALRGQLIGNALRGCVLCCDARLVTAMFWPVANHEVTAFVHAAGPPHALHAQFDQAAAPDQPARQGRATAARGQGPDSAGVEREKLLSELNSLRARIVDLQRMQTVQGAMETLGLDDARLKAMLRLLHPDRHANSEAANDAAKWLNGLRDILKANTGN